MKDPSEQRLPLIFKRLLEVEANYFICSEWQKQDPAKSRSFIHSRRRHFHNTKRSLASYVTTSDQPQRSDDVLVDESKEAQIHDLGEALKELEIKGNYFGNYSLTIVVYDQDLAKVESACADFYKAFNVHDAQLYEEKYNLFNAYLATVPGNYAFNLRSMLILNTNYADYSLVQMTVDLVSRVQSKNQGVVGVVRVEDEHGAEIEGVVAGNGRKIRVE